MQAAVHSSTVHRRPPAAIGRKSIIHPQFLFLPLIFPLLHVAYGIGTIVGLIEIPFWQRKIKNSDYQERIDEVKRKVAENTEIRWGDVKL